MSEPAQKLDAFENRYFNRGASRLVELLWMFVQASLFGTWLPGSCWRVHLLRFFGACIGRGVVIKPHVSVKFPWRLTVGDHVWIGERVWIDNLARVTIHDHVCISQGAYLCTGSHDWSDRRFGLVTEAIEIGRGAWIGARSNLAPGTILEDGAIVAMGTLAKGRLRAMTVYLSDGSTKTRGSST